MIENSTYINKLKKHIYYIVIRKISTNSILNEKFYFYKKKINNSIFMTEPPNSYDAEDIQVLKGLEGVNFS